MSGIGGLMKVNVAINVAASALGLQSWSRTVLNILAPILFIFWLVSLGITAIPFVSSYGQYERGQGADVGNHVECFWFNDLESCNKLIALPPLYLPNGQKNYDNPQWAEEKSHQGMLMGIDDNGRPYWEDGTTGKFIRYIYDK